MELQTEPYNPEKVEKNHLYKISGTTAVVFEEKEAAETNVVVLDFSIEKEQYGLIAKEYRNPIFCKKGCKAADVLAFFISPDIQRVCSVIADIKTNISDFSDDLLKDNALITAIKEVRDFKKQISDERVSKNTIMTYFSSLNYSENEYLGIFTSNFQSEKYIDAANMLRHILSTPPNPTDLVRLKLYPNLLPYKDEEETLRDFSNKKLRLQDNLYDLQIWILEKMEDERRVCRLKMGTLNTGDVLEITT